MAFCSSYHGLIGRQLGVELLAVVMVVGQGGVNRSEGQVGPLRDDLARRHPLAVMPDNNILDSDTAAGDTRLAAARVGGRDYVLADDRQDARLRGSVSGLAYARIHGDHPTTDQQFRNEVQ